MPPIHRVQYRPRLLIRIAHHIISQRRDIPRASDHPLHRGSPIRFAEAGAAVVLGGRDDPGGERGAEGARFYDQDFDAEGVEFVGEGLVDGFDGGFAGGVGGSAGSGDESGCNIEVLFVK